MNSKVIVGSRGSKLALAQTRWVIDLLRQQDPGLDIEIKVIKTQGDKMLDVPLARIGGKGLFVKEIEYALLDGRIDIAVHSMKDLPTEETQGLMIAAIPEREDPGDVMLSPFGSIDDLPQAARVGSSSLRRRAQLLHYRPDLTVEDLRGNLDTRLRRLEQGDFDAIIVAAAGLNRLGFDEKRYRIPFDVLLPAAGQGVLAVQCRSDDVRIIHLLMSIDDYPSRACVVAERSLMKSLGGGCQVPIAALAVAEGDRMRLRGRIADLAGERLIEKTGYANMEEGDKLGATLARDLLDAGAGEILDQVRGSIESR